MRRFLGTKKLIARIAAIMCILSLVVHLTSTSNVSAASWNGKSFGNPVDLGVPTYNISINDAVFGKEDGREVLYTTVSSSNAVFNIVDVRDNRLVRSFNLTGVAQSWRHAIAPDGTVYIAGITLSNHGELWSYSPVTKTVQNLGEPIPGEKSLWSMTTDDLGNVYGGTFQSGKVFKYDPVAKTFKDYGSMVTGQEYVRSMAYYKGFIYAGIGSVGQVVKLNVTTGEKTVISQNVPGLLGVTPDKVPFAYDMTVVDGTLLVRFSYDTKNDLLFFDLENQVWLNKKIGSTISGETGIGVFGFNQLTAVDGKLYIIGNRKLVELDMTTFEAKTTPISFGSSLRGAEWIEFTDDPNYPGKSLVTLTSNGKLIIMNVKDGLRKDLPAVVKGAPNPLHNLEQGPDGKLYMSGYPGGLGAQYDPKTGKNVNFTLGQSEGMVGLGDYMYYGVYPGANIYRSAIGTAVPTVEPVFQIGSDQDRPYIMIAADNKLFIGTIPGYGKLGGALTIYDPVTGGKKVYSDIVHNQSITGLAYRNGIIYGSTNVYGGLGVVKTETKAKMFIWDVAQEKKLAEFTLDLPELDQPPMITGLTFGPDGLLWGNVDGIVFKMNPDTYQIVGYKDIYPNVNNYGFWRPYHPHWGKDGLLYVDLADIITVIDPKTMDFVQLSPTGKEISFFTIAEDVNGNENIYYTDAANLMMIPIGETLVHHIPVRNGGFEETVQNGSIPGWTNPYLKGGFPMVVTNEFKHSGSHSLKVVDNSRGVSGGLLSDRIAAKPGETYTTSMSVYINSGQPADAALLLYFYDKDDKQLDYKFSPFSDKTPNRWSQVEVTGTAPEGTTHLAIMAYSSKWSLIDAYYDDITLSIIITDDTPPVTVAALEGTKQNGWYVSDVKVNLNATDDKSGVTKTVYSLDGGNAWLTYQNALVFNEDGVHTVSFRSTDMMGNEEQLQTTTFSIDQTAPAVQISGGGTYTVDQTVTVTCTATDAVSGVVYSSCSAPLLSSPAYLLNVGDNVVSANATDAAGNSGTAATTVTVKVTVDSLIRLIEAWVTGNGSQGIVNSLGTKLRHGQFDAFINEVHAQKGKEIPEEAANYLLKFVNDLKS
ncbi:hypothetical protein GC102_33220 [Paenibacillus sp. LMG 31460]|uniref:CBM-cenC domain-containing protein n=1 Tax=Paenibacillus germinis TaxID=2654979 RepID=A0ABX1ZB52_9BACL|nr:carbohydrate binding domain-containing protein [Paenibacillus germinis]NOU90562.1 hypothetical protein [Paenibacillus germinis]